MWLFQKETVLRKFDVPDYVINHGIVNISTLMDLFQSSKVSVQTFLYRLGKFWYSLTQLWTKMMSLKRNNYWLWLKDAILIQSDTNNVRPFSHDVMPAVLVFQNNKTAAMLVFQTNPVGVGLFSYVNDLFCSNKFAYMLATWVKTLYSFL